MTRHGHHRASATGEPELRAIAGTMEAAGVSGEICDANFRLVFISSEEARIIGVDPGDVVRFYGKSLPRRQMEDGEYWATTDDSSRDWWKLNVPIMRTYLEPGNEDFDAVFGNLADAAARIEPRAGARAWWSTHSFPDHEGLRTSRMGDVTFLDVRTNDDDGRFIGNMRLSTGAVGDSLLLRLGRGDTAMHECMNDLDQPARRSASILFADLESSGEVSREKAVRDAGAVPVAEV